MRAGVSAKNICSWVGQRYSCADTQKCQEYPYIIFLGWITVPTLLLTLCLLQNVFVDIKAEKKRVKMKVSFWLEWAVNLNVWYLTGAGLQNFSWKRKTEFLLVEDSLSVSSMSDCVTKFMPRTHSRRGSPYETQMPWIKRPYLVPAQAQGNLCCPMF